MRAWSLALRACKGDHLVHSFWPWPHNGFIDHVVGGSDAVVERLPQLARYIRVNGRQKVVMIVVRGITILGGLVVGKLLVGYVNGTS